MECTLMSAQLNDSASSNTSALYCERQVVEARPSATMLKSDDDVNSASVAVLTNIVLWQSVTQFVDGWPYAVARMYHMSNAHECCRKRKNRAFTFPRQPGVLPHLAILLRDERALSVLYDLYLTWYYGRKPVYCFDKALACAVHVGDLKALTWLLERSPMHTSWSWGQDALRTALVHEDTELLDLVYAHCPPSHRVFNADKQAQVDNVALIAWLHEHGVTFTPEALKYAARHGHLAVVQYLHEHVAATRSPNGMDYAARYGHFDVVLYLHHAHAACTTRCMDSAASQGRLDVVELLHNERTEGCTVGAMDRAARYGHLDIVRFLHSHRTEGCTTRALDSAAEYGHFDVVRFLLDHRHENGTTQAGFWAAYNSKHRVLKLLLDRAPHLCSDELLEDAAMGKCEQVLQIVCVHSTKGCLFAARERARTWHNERHVEILSQFISSEVASCSLAMHRADAHARRCQVVVSSSDA